MFEYADIFNTYVLYFTYSQLQFFLLNFSQFFAFFYGVFCFISFIKKNKVNQKSEIFELLLFITTRYNKVACSLIGANLLPSIFSLRSKKQICICSHSLTRLAYNRSLRSLNAFLSHLGVKIMLCCV